ncbi:MAG: MFS transporter [Sulfitobacter sp.]
MRHTKANTSKSTKPGALFCLSLSMLLASLGTSIANIALPAIAKDLNAPFHQVQWVVIAYLTTLTLFSVLAGRLGDRFGRQQMLVFGLVLFAMASAFCGLAPSLWVLSTARSLQGIGAAFLMVLTIALVRDVFGTERVGRAMGLLGTMSAVGTALGPSLGGMLVGKFGWHGVFFILVPISLIAAAMAVRLLPAGAASVKPSRFGLSALRTSGAIPGLAANLLVANVMMATLLIGPFFLGQSLGLHAAMVGFVMSVGPVISIFFGVPSGRLVDAWGSARVLSLGLIALATGAFALALLPIAFGVIGYVAAISILTPGYQLFQAANNTLIMVGVSADQRGTISGLLSLSRNLGLIFGASFMGMVFSFGIGTRTLKTASADAIANGMQLAFVTCGALVVVAYWLSLKGNITAETVSKQL